MLTVLETLGPAERAVFVLREVFDLPYDEVAEAVGRTPAAVRQIARRARHHIAARQPRVSVNRSEHQAVVAGSSPRCTPGASRTFWRSWRRTWSSSPTAAIRIDSDSARAAVSLVVEDGRVTRIYATSNPRKLTRLDEPTDLTR